MRQSIRNLKADVLARGGKLHAIYRFLRCDETPMKMTIVDNDALELLPTELQEKLQQLYAQFGQDKDIGIAKLLQCEMQVAVLVEVRGAWRVFSWQPPCPIQSMSRCTPENYALCLHAHEQSLGFDDLADGFQYKRIWRNTDGDGAVGRSRRVFSNLEHRDPTTASFSALCKIHAKNTDREEAFKIMSDTASKIRRAILSITFANHRKLFRVALKEALANVHFERAAAPGALEKHRNLETLNHLIPDTEENQLRRSIIMGTFGKWGVGELTVHAAPRYTDQQIQAWLLGPVRRAIVGPGPGNFPSRSWTRSEQSVRFLALLALLGLLEPAYERYCALISSKQRPAPATVGLEPLPAIQDICSRGYANMY